MARITIEEEASRGRGWARFTVRPRPEVGTPRLVLSRRQGDKPFLGPSGWQTRPHGMAPDAVIDAPDAGIYLYGPAVTAHLSLDDGIEVSFEGTDIRERHHWPDIAPPPLAGAKGGAVRIEGSSAVVDGVSSEATPAAPPVAEQQVDVVGGKPPKGGHKESGPHQTPLTPGPWRQNSSVWLASGLLLLILVAIALGTRYSFRERQAEQVAATVDAPTSEEPRALPEPAAPAPDAAVSFGERFERYRREHGHARELQVLAQEARAGGDIEIATRALGLAAQRGSPEANLAMGRRYDPGVEPVVDYPVEKQPLSAARYYCRATALGAPDAAGLLAALKQRAAAPPREEAALFLDMPADYECEPR